MTFVFRPADEVSVRGFLGWRYDPPYDFYNVDPNEEETEIQYCLQPTTACYIIIDERNNLVAFCTFGQDGQVPGGNYADDALDIGMGVRPDLTGQGNGRIFVNAVLDFARRTFSPIAFRVTVAEFNQGR